MPLLLQYDKESDIPVESKDSFVEFEQDNKKVFMHKDLANAKKEGFKTKGDLTSLTNSYNTFKGSIETKQQEASDLAKSEKDLALKNQMEQLKTDGKTSELHDMQIEIERNAKAALELQLEESNKKFTDLQTSLVDSRESELSTKIATQFTKTEFIPAVAQLIKANRMTSAEGVSSFVNSGGEAVGTDIEQIVTLLRNDPAFSPFAKAASSKPGVGANGGQQSAVGALDLNKPFTEMSTKEQTEYIRQKHAKG